MHAIAVAHGQIRLDDGQLAVRLTILDCRKALE